MALASPLTYFALAISPIVAVIFIAFYWIKREPDSQPSIVAAIPLGLSSIAILLAQSAVILLATFQEIATQRAAGMKAVIAGLLQAQRPITWGLLDFGACLIAVILVSVFQRYSREAEGPLMHAHVALPALIATAVVLVTLFLMVYLQYGTVDMVMMVVDNHRYHELASQAGAASMGEYARRISTRLVSITFLSVLQFCALIVAGALDLFWRQKENSRQAFATILTVGAIVACGVSALSELGFVDYLEHVR